MNNVINTVLYEHTLLFFTCVSVEVCYKMICLCTCRSSTNASWDILHVSASDEGLYECMAQSTAGVGLAYTHFTVIGL